MHVVFIGLPGSGKSTWGARLADHLGGAFVDLDEAIAQRAAQSISEIFARHGEAHFRALETQVLKDELARTDGPVVLATGGGTLVSEANRAVLHKAHRIWLNPPMAALQLRLANEWTERPLLAAAGETGWREKLEDLAEARVTMFREMAHEEWTSQTDTVLEGACKRLALSGPGASSGEH